MDGIWIRWLQYLMVVGFCILVSLAVVWLLGLVFGWRFQPGAVVTASAGASAIAVGKVLFFNKDS